MNEGGALLFQLVLRQGRENENGLTFSAKKVGSAGRDLFAVAAAVFVETTNERRLFPNAVDTFGAL